MRPSTANNQLQLYPLCSHRLLYCDSTAFEGSIEMNISPATTVCFLAVSKYAIGIIHVFFKVLCLSFWFCHQSVQNWSYVIHPVEEFGEIMNVIWRNYECNILMWHEFTRGWQKRDHFCCSRRGTILHGQSRALFGEVGPESIGPRRAVGSQQLLAGPRASHGPWFPCARWCRGFLRSGSQSEQKLLLINVY